MVEIKIKNEDFEELDNLERKFNEYLAAQDNLKFIMSSEDISDQMLERIMDRADKRQMIMAEARDKLGNKYMPEANVSNFYFDFANKTVVFK